MDEKDRMGDKLRAKQKADEDRFFAERDKAALEKIRQAKIAQEEDAIRELARNRCPRCGTVLSVVEQNGVTVDECPNRHGMWLDDGELEQLASREHDSWLGRFFNRSK
jgi:hypothetical protein